MKQYRLYLIFIILLYSTYSLAVNCQKPSTIQCDFYQKCLENKISCGSSGYAISYGQYYCNRFISAQFPTITGGEWRNVALLCLQNKLAEQLDKGNLKTCKKIESFSFDSHAICYIKPDPSRSYLSICEIPFEDIKFIMSDILNLSDLASVNSMKPTLEVIGTCLKRWNYFLNKNVFNKSLSSRKEKEEIIMKTQLFRKILIDLKNVKKEL